MSHIRVLICRVEDNSPDALTQLAALDLPEADVSSLHAETALDDLEAATQKSGHALLRRLLEAQWEEIDAKLTQQTRQSFPPSHP